MIASHLHLYTGGLLVREGGEGGGGGGSEMGREEWREEWRGGREKGGGLGEGRGRGWEGLLDIGLTIYIKLCVDQCSI